ncbi:acetolactate decarboxylase [Lactobacillus delbrueckii]|nr:acetolactate decarboxylase [Lactobacillus delbrueckii]TLQ33691.1 acetolactate decarboxylase [Lactobacillus delbrueckii subsp. bulgaricus]MCD5552111.1 hypothetical protein [Lactobacillus delbrueckii subsp. lactis]MCD5571072.1 hypothetical protein [Lactobacillus delbrueckii subsp. lactis]MCD5577070.1 hypothetical protein [Lactobacillus delbrueckii subsp. lactis]MCD5604459.1 hypothetical protein [Lactobacillus delbrueckii subsp. lactis]
MPELEAYLKGQGMGNIFYAVKLTGRFAKMKATPTTHVTSTKATQS